MRQTKQRQLILDLLQTAGEPITAGELYKRAQQHGGTLAKSTVYRNLESMAQRGEVERGFLSNGESFFSNAQTAHHHYMICKGCHKMQDLPLCPLHQMEQAAEQQEFAVTDHVIQLYGYCKECLKAGRS